MKMKNWEIIRSKVAKWDAIGPVWLPQALNTSVLSIFFISLIYCWQASVIDLQKIQTAFRIATLRRKFLLQTENLLFVRLG